jgi:hypothetical protein
MCLAHTNFWVQFPVSNKIKIPQAASGSTYYSPSTWDAEADKSRVQGQPWLQRDTLSQNKNKN